MTWPGPRLLTVWVVYDHPTDAPDYYVVRRQWPRPDGSIEVDPQSAMFFDLARARDWLAWQGLTCLPRQPDDDPVIVETWV